VKTRIMAGKILSTKGFCGHHEHKKANIIPGDRNNVIKYTNFNKIHIKPLTGKNFCFKMRINQGTTERLWTWYP